MNAFHRMNECSAYQQGCVGKYRTFLSGCAVAWYLANINLWLGILSKCRFQGGTQDAKFHPALRWHGCCSSQTQKCDGSLPLGKQGVPHHELLSWQGNCVKIPVAFTCHKATSVLMVPAPIFRENSAGSFGEVSLGWMLLKEGL